MKSTQLHESHGQRTYALIFDVGDEVMSNLLEFARQHRLGGSQITAIGAFQKATLAYFNWETKEYEKIPVSEQVEVVSLVGDIALDEKGEPKVHVHAVLGKRDGSAVCGHLQEGTVRPTLEVIVTESPQHLQRRHDSRTGLSLISIGAGK